MKITTILTSIAATALMTSTALSDGHAGTAGYALSSDGSTLMVMNSIAATDDVTSVTLSTPVRSIAWRPVTSELVGFADGMIVTIDPMTGETMDAGATFMEDAVIASDAVVAFDFNNAIDAVRAVSTQGDNLVYFPADFGDDKANSVRRFTDLYYADGDTAQGMEPMVFANAYSNAIAGMKASETFQYALDAGTDSLVSLANNDGTLTTIAPIMIDGAPADITTAGGFDIVSPEEGADAAYAILHIEGQETAGLYAIDLKTGEAAMLADLGTADISSFAISMGM